MGGAGFSRGRGRGTALLPLALALCALAPRARADFVIESGSLKVSFPPEAKARFPGGFDVALANFGEPLYGGTLQGRLVYADPSAGVAAACAPECRFACSDLGAATPPLDLRRLPGAAPGVPPILLVDRGPSSAAGAAAACKFAEKVWNAQRAGAAGVVVANYEDELTTMEAPDDDDEAAYLYLRNITVPAVFVTRSTADALKGLLAGGAEARVSLDWTDALPRARVVEWEFWTNSNDQCGPTCDVQAEFVRAMAPVAREFGAAGWTRFTPHYIVWTCPPAYRDSPECASQCVRRGRYCAPDPDGSLREGYSGAEVVAENLRQLCVFRLAAAAAPPRPAAWWEYATRFASACAMDAKEYGQACAEKVFGELVGAEAWAGVEDLRRCVGDVGEDAAHAVLEEQLAAQAGGGAGGGGEVFILPTLRVNGAQYRGRLAVPDVLRAICAGFEAGNRPPACDRAGGDGACMEGGAGATACAARDDGKTACVSTYGGFECACGRGFLPHTEADGTETCLDVNECLSVTQLDPSCTCARCACKNTRGGYECVTDIPDECAADNGGCWAGDFPVGGKQQRFSACRDNLPAYRDALARGQPAEALPPLHNCACPPCFIGVERRGKVACEPRCAPDLCDADAGVCHADPAGGGRLSAAQVAGVVVGVAAALAAAAAVAYKLHIRAQMESEVRSILAQYMPLGDQDGVEPGGAGRGLLPVGAPGSGLG